MTVLVLLAIMVALAAPSFIRWIAVHRVNTALNYLRADLHYARMLAVRNGTSVELRFDPAGRDRCVNSYAVVILGEIERQAKQVSLATETRGVCLWHNNNARLIYDSRGLPRGVVARTFRAASAGAEDSLKFSQLGRVLRTY